MKNAYTITFSGSEGMTYNQSQKLWDLHPLVPYSILVASLIGHSCQPLPDIAFPDLAQKLN